jgi:hypothetical protein
MVLANPRVFGDSWKSLMNSASSLIAKLSETEHATFDTPHKRTPAHKRLQHFHHDATLP